jgi:hypothetical protein
MRMRMMRTMRIRMLSIVVMVVMMMMRRRKPIPTQMLPFFSSLIRTWNLFGGDLGCGKVNSGRNGGNATKAAKGLRE